MNVLNGDLIVALLGGFATLAIFSLLLKENPVYRAAEHLYIGIAAGLGVLLTVKSFLWAKLLVPMMGLDIVQYPDGTYSKEYNSMLLLYILPMCFGMLYYFIYSKKHAWLAKVVIGCSLGMSGGLAFKGFFNKIMPQLTGSFKPLVVKEVSGGINWFSSLENCIFVFTLLAVMYYFFFSFKHKSAGKNVATSGRWLLMICFGAFFGSTVMARLSLLVERLQFLIGPWFNSLKDLVGMVQ